MKMVLMKHRRELLRDGLASLVMVALNSSETRASPITGMKTIYQRDLPPVNLAGWQVTVLELTFPPGTASPRHLHPGFILGYVLEGDLRFHLEDEPEKVLTTGDVFYEAPGSIHLSASSASTTRQARILALAFGVKGSEITKLL
jgi:quercetin dioxygenase-like cupin family protein